LLVVGCGSRHEPRPTPTPSSRPSPAPTAPPTPAPVREPALAVGITEPNPNFVVAPGAPLATAPGGPPEPFAHLRDELGAMRPAYYRLVLDWARLQPREQDPPDLTAGDPGCARDVQPCAGYAGLVDQLRALASRQAAGGWETLVVVTDTPAWAAEPNDGCPADSGGMRSGAVRSAALPAYRALIQAVLAAAQQTGAVLRWWSPWNEPNHPYFFPQRAACDSTAPSRAPAAYLPLARTLRDTLATAPGDQRLALGELAASLERKRRSTTIAEFVAGLPRDLACSAGVWTQHAYVGGSDPVDALAGALHARGCDRLPPIWITETGVGPADARFANTRGVAAQRRGCRMLQARLRAWWRDPRVAAAFQYTFREDPLFRTGLVSADLADVRPSLRAWQAWGARRPDAPPPPDPC
jgi:hypothetical protein